MKYSIVLTEDDRIILNILKKYYWEKSSSKVIKKWLEDLKRFLCL
jgi:hypothetical protein